MNKPVIAIVGGTGLEGTGLAMRWATAGYQVIIGSRKTERAETTAAELNQQLGINTITGKENPEAVKNADICVLTVVSGVHKAAVESLKDDLQGKLVVDATARVKFPEAAPPDPPSAGRIAQDILGDDTRVVTAYQNVPARALKKNLDQPVDCDVLICGDDMEAVDAVVALTADAGMRGLYAGGLDNAFVVEGLTALIITMNKTYKGHGMVKITGLNQ
ncbi:MAG: NADPH-dependent F420 reductase [Anaerolineales bacterium]|jgi:NADPH-dependent F420 reductase